MAKIRGAKKKRKKKGKKKKIIPADHPCLRFPLDDRVDQASLFLPPRLAAKVKEIYKQARFEIWRLYERDKKRKWG